MKTSEMRKLVSQLYKMGQLTENGEKPAQPTKYIYNMRKDDLQKVIDSKIINYSDGGKVYSKSAKSGSPDGNSDGDADGDSSGNTDGNANGDTDGNADKKLSIDDMKKAIEALNKSAKDSINTDRKYVTSNGLVDAKVIREDLNLNAIDSTVGLIANMAKDALEMAKNADGGIGGDITIKIGNMPKVSIKDEHLHPAFDRVLFHLVNDKNVYLYGSAGAGKTTMAYQLAKSLKSERFACYSCTAGMSESMITGKCLFNGEYFSTEFVEIVKNGGLVLLDEFDAIDGNLGVYLNSFLANGILQTSNNRDEPSVKRHADCYIIGAGNTDGNGNGSRIYSGRNKLDGATLDRFTAIKFEYDAKLEKKLSGGHNDLYKALNKLRKRVDDYEINRVVSTRAYLKLGKWMSAGKDLKYCLDTLTESWTEFEIEKADLVSLY